ncbi:hypothetical protein GJ744_003453 [Endocarpon pusillum]|uniref:Heterokaryon incompatibility domain-containing protein n=1 Tax=Endocarpon pusillum TaxID=364733 RepID=A0A8H7E731_9EURO|nr:hypothetical protein GJ744_003453 [Endocarpon pusillum]
MASQDLEIELQHLLRNSEGHPVPCLCCSEVVEAFRQRLHQQDTFPSFPQIVERGGALVRWTLDKIETECTYKKTSYEDWDRHLWRYRVDLVSRLYRLPISLFIQRSSNQAIAHRWQSNSVAPAGPHLGRTRPLIPSYRLLRQWTADCTNYHGPGCQKPYVKEYSHCLRSQVEKVRKHDLMSPLPQDGAARAPATAPSMDGTPETRWTPETGLKRDIDLPSTSVRESLLTQQLNTSLNGSTSLQMSRRPLRYIDVTRRCLVELSEPAPYVTLSYVWGNVELPVLSEYVVEAFSREGALTDGFLPRTIADAIKVTQELRQRYLWVDCLCIMQSHDVEKQDAIRNMHEIYAGAFVTIIAANGMDANHGLHGVTPESRNFSPATFWIRGVPLIVSLDPFPAKWWLGDTPWLHRGWTFQEKALSPRCLIFTQQQIYWECRRSLWCEDRIEETPGSPSLYAPTFTYGLSYRDPFGPFTAWNDEYFMAEYCTMVAEYSERSLTYEHDILSAFEGILGMFKVAEGRDFLWGLPRSCLAQSFAWSFRSQPKRRNVRTTIVMSDSEPLYCSFPSWSWVGWIGPIGPVFADPWKAELVTFYFMDHNFEMQMLRDEAADLARRRPLDVVSDIALLSASPKLAFADESQELMRSVHWRPRPWNTDQNSAVYKSDVAEHLLASPDLPSFLFCRTSIAKLPEHTFSFTDGIVIDGDRDEVVVMPVCWNNGVAYPPLWRKFCHFFNWLLQPLRSLNSRHQVKSVQSNFMSL